MRNYYLFFIFLFTFGWVYAQIDQGVKGKPIKGGGIVLPDNTPPTPSVDLWKKDEKPTKDYFNLEKKSKIDLTQKDDFVKPKTKFDPGIPKREGASHEDFKKDQYFGDVITKSKTLRLICRDHETVDGDKVKILHNGKVIREEVNLTGDYKSIEVELQPGFNKFEFIAINEGMYSPNTAEFRIVDENGVSLIGNVWNMAAGYKASFIVVKEE
ncbi:MAG: hypothetical protein ACK4JX_09520 [Flavobacterium sp.]